MNPPDDDDDPTNHSPCCPSFNTYTKNDHVADTVNRVLVEPRDIDSSDIDDFEFECVNSISGSLPVYPVFDRDLLRDLGSHQSAAAANIQLRNLFFEEDKDFDYNHVDNNNNNMLAVGSSVNSNVVDGLEGISPQTYCLWTPKTPSTALSPSKCMKSSSTGSGPQPVVSKTWRLRNLLRRSKSDGKDGLMLMTASKSPSPSPSPSSSPMRSPSKGGLGEKRKSYLPYKQELMGFFRSPQTLRRINIPPF